MRSKRIVRMVVLLAAMAAGGIGCEIRSSSTTERQTLYIAGVYRDPDGGRIVDRNSGAGVRHLNVRQMGDRIEAVDNNGRLFRGRFVGQGDFQGVLDLRGDTTTGVPVTIQGTITVSGSKGYLRGTWIEPNLLGSIIAEADLIVSNPPPVTNTVAQAPP